VASAVIRGVTQTGVKAGLVMWADPFAAGLVGYSVSSAIILVLRGTRRIAPVPWREHGMFMLVGVCNAGAVLSMYVALAHGAVGVVAPLVATYPLFTIGFSALMLREERLHARLLGGVALTVAGVVLVLVG
jgi:drug/metabolite transporter (DMT)-like permease